MGPEIDLMLGAFSPYFERTAIGLCAKVGFVEGHGTTAKVERLFSAVQFINGRSAMTTRCDHCRRSLGLNVHRYWRMRFCSVDCVAAYQRRLQEGTVGKIRCLELGDTRMPTALNGGLRKEAA
jgi:hypothetical protein